MNDSKNPFPFSVGFPLSVRTTPGQATIALVGADRGLGFPILCEIPKGSFADSDAQAIKAACERAVEDWSNPDAARIRAAAPDLLAALELAAELVKTARGYFPGSIRNSDKFRLENVNAQISSAIARAKTEPACLTGYFPTHESKN